MRPVLTRLLSPVAAACLGAALLVAGCGSGTSGTSTGSPGADACSTAAACGVSSVSAVTGPSGTTPACSNPGSRRTDDFTQKVTLTAQPDGLKLGDITVGTGPQARTGQVVTVDYSGWLQDGTLFDSSRKAGGQPLQTQLGAHGLIPGFEEAITTMHVGGVRRAVIPPELGYGAAGGGPIPPNATLTFDLELLCATP